MQFACLAARQNAGVPVVGREHVDRAAARADTEEREACRGVELHVSIAEAVRAAKVTYDTNLQS